MPPQGRCEWNVNQRARLIQLVKQFDIIWLPVGATDKSKISASRRAAFEQIRQHFLEDGFTDLANSVDELASQWRNLKDIFYKRFKEMNRRIQMGEANVKPPWRFFDALSFLAGSKAMDANRREVFGDSVNGVFADDDVSIEDSLSNFGMLDEFNQSAAAAEESIMSLIKAAVKEEQPEQIEEEQQQHVPTKDGDEEGQYEQNGETEEGGDGERRTTSGGRALPMGSMGHQQQEMVGDRGEGTVHSNRRQPISRRTKRKMSFGDEGAGNAAAKRAFVPQRHLSPIWDGLRQHSFATAFGSSPLQVRCSMQHKPRQCTSTGTNSAAYFLSPTNTPSINAETSKTSHSSHPPSGHGFRSKRESGGPDNDRFRYFGAFVESAVRDLFHQCPDLSRRLLHAIYGMIAEHQMEATLMFDGDEGPMNAQELMDDLGIDGEGATEGTDSHCWMP